MLSLFVLLFSAFIALTVPGAPRTVVQAAPVVPAGASELRLVKRYGELPLSFEANHGQTDGRVRFLSRGSGYTLFLTGDEAVLSLKSQKAGARSQNKKRPWSVVSGQLRKTKTTDQGLRTTDVLRMKLMGANRAAKVTALDELPGKTNYFIGNDPKKWRTGVPTYGKVKYEGVYPGVDLVYYGNQRQLEYDFVVAPGADPKTITLAVGAGLSPHDHSGSVKPPLRIDASGDLVVEAEGGEVRFHKPVVYQPTRSLN